MAEPDTQRPYHTRLIAELAQGRSLRDAAAAAGISERTASRWLAANRSTLLREIVVEATEQVLSRLPRLPLMGFR